MSLVRRETLFAGAAAILLGAFCLPACSSASDAAAPSCTNGTKDDGEEGVDCGGICPEKCTGTTCTADTECGSGKCATAVCAAPAGKACGVGAPVPTCNDGDPCELDKDCKSGFCDGAKCATPAAGSHTDGQKNGGETGIDCGGSVKMTAPCPDGQGCIDSTDCVGTCNAGICGPISHTDGKKNLDETDVDCGGASAPKCVDGKGCAADVDCVTGFCPTATKICTAPTYSDGVKNGNETDVDCGGTGPGMKACAEGLVCVVDTDCFGACSYLKKCVDTPSCKGHFGGDTCGTNEVGTGAESHLGPGGVVVANHESCCRSLPVAGFTDPTAPVGKTVYVDKYEITAGRMRAFLETLGGGVDAAGNAKGANVKAYMAVAAHHPGRWNTGWEDALPTANIGSTFNFTVKNATTDLLYPGQDIYSATGAGANVTHFTQNTWWVGDAAGPQPGGTSVNFSVDNGVFNALGAAHFFPEYHAGSNWPQGPDYAASHSLNCTNTGTNAADGSYGYSTYWFDQTTVITYSGGTHGKYFSKDQLDEKSLNCTPNALFAAFCAWDGGQLATAEVIDNITGNTLSPIYDSGACPGGAACQNGKLAVGQSTCNGPGGANTIVSYPDGGGTPCAGVYYYPNDNGNDYYDGSSRIASPGRVIGDSMSKSAADEPWMDVIGNLEEVVLKKGETKRFDYRGYGTEWSSIVHHHNQQSTARGKGGAFGARCMRFR